VLLALLGLHAAVAALARPAAERLGRGVLVLCALPPLAAVLLMLNRAPWTRAPLTETWTWVGPLNLGLDLRLDGFAAVMVALVSGIGVVVFAYAARYFPARPRGDRSGLGRFAATLLAFSGSMLGLVLADHLLALYVFWELTSVTSYLLIGTEHEQGSTRAAALQALLTTTLGSLAMLAGFVLLGESAGTYVLSEVLAAPPTGATATAGALLALAGAFTKSAQVPFHTWLPAAMAAPTPVSAYLHSATMVKAGVYLVARMAPAFAVIGGWRALVVSVGVATMLVGGYRALRQHDLKLLLAFGTVSQLGFLTALFGAGTPETTLAGTALIVAHGAFKASLFMVVGVIDHQAHTRDLRQLSGLGRRLPALAVTAVLAGASMAGLPPLLGFVAKEAALEAYLHGGITVAGFDLGPVALVGLVLGNVLTTAYTARFLWGAFATKPMGETHGCVGAHVDRPGPAVLAPAGLLAAGSLLAGLVPAAVSPLVVGGALALDDAVDPEPLALWHGINVALGLSVLGIAAGLLLFGRRARVARRQERLARARGANQAYGWALRGLNRAADLSTGTLQNGSLPVYLGVVLLTLVALPASALWRLGEPGPLPVLAESPLQLAVGVGVIAAAVGVALVRRRFAAVLLLGGVGYGMALLFVVQGAPDLALTQLLIETLSLVVFVLVLRHLPERFEDRPWPLGRALRLVTSLTVGAAVAVGAVVARNARTGGTVAEEYLARSLPEAEGRNVVNVILVDFRGIDTFGEITVLSVAAVGVAALVRAVRVRGVGVGGLGDDMTREER